MESSSNNINAINSANEGSIQYSQQDSNLNTCPSESSHGQGNYRMSSFCDSNNQTQIENIVLSYSYDEHKQSSGVQNMGETSFTPSGLLYSEGAENQNNTYTDNPERAMPTYFTPYTPDDKNSITYSYVPITNSQKNEESKQQVYTESNKTTNATNEKSSSLSNSEIKNNEAKLKANVSIKQKFYTKEIVSGLLKELEWKNNETLSTDSFIEKLKSLGASVDKSVEELYFKIEKNSPDFITMDEFIAYMSKSFELKSLNSLRVLFESLYKVNSQLTNISNNLNINTNTDEHQLMTTLLLRQCISLFNSNSLELQTIQNKLHEGNLKKYQDKIISQATSNAELAENLNYVYNTNQDNEIQASLLKQNLNKKTKLSASYSKIPTWETQKTSAGRFYQSGQETITNRELPARNYTSATYLPALPSNLSEKIVISGDSDISKADPLSQTYHSYIVPKQAGQLESQWDKFRTNQIAPGFPMYPNFQSGPTNATLSHIPNEAFAAKMMAGQHFQEPNPGNFQFPMMHPGMIPSQMVSQPGLYYPNAVLANSNNNLMASMAMNPQNQMGCFSQLNPNSQMNFMQMPMMQNNQIQHMNQLKMMNMGNNACMPGFPRMMTQMNESVVNNANTGMPQQSSTMASVNFEATTRGRNSSTSKNRSSSLVNFKFANTLLSMFGIKNDEPEKPVEVQKTQMETRQELNKPNPEWQSKEQMFKSNNFEGAYSVNNDNANKFNNRGNLDKPANYQTRIRVKDMSEIPKPKLISEHVKSFEALPNWPADVDQYAMFAKLNPNLQMNFETN